MFGREASAGLRVALLAFVACGPASETGGGGASPTAPALCTTTLPPREPVPAPAPPIDLTAPAHASRIIANVELKLASIAKQLETKVPPRLAEERGKPAGAAGHMNYTVDRGPFRAAVEHDALVIRTDIHAHAEACKGSACYASCAPDGVATAVVSLRLGKDYRFAPSHVTFAFTKGCVVNVLGLLRVDVTPMIAANVQPALQKVEHDIDASLPPMAGQAQQLWTQLDTPRSMPLGLCAIVNPTGLVEGPIEGTPEALRVRLGLTATPEIRRGACPPATTTPLPPLAQDPSLPPEDDVVLALVSPLSSVSLGGPVTRAEIVQSGANAQLDLTLHGATCGDATIVAPVEWADDKTSLHFANDLVKAQTFDPAVSPSALQLAVPALASSMSDPNVAVTAKISSVTPLVAGLRQSNVVAYAVARGSLTLTEAH